MAGPLTTEEIEDVVSSVRRLVSNEQSSRRLSRDLGGERLLLTPSLRVVPDASPLAPLVLQTPLADSLDTAGSQPDAVDPAEPGAPLAEVIEAEWEDALWVPPEAVSLGEVALGAEEAEVLLPPADAMPESFAVEPDDVPDAWGETAPDGVEDEPVPFVPLRRRAEALASTPAAAAASGDADPAPEHATSDAVTPDVDPALYEDLGDTDHPIAAAAGPEVVPPAFDEAVQSGGPQRFPTEIVDADGTPLAVLDEAALQEIVRQMIRDELQGTLGERITRNVRKLVRAEIHRALIARDLD